MPQVALTGLTTKFKRNRGEVRQKSQKFVLYVEIKTETITELIYTTVERIQSEHS